MYSEDFLQAFEKSDFFTICKKTVTGKLKWKDWSDCSVSCGGGTQTKIASSCVPDYAVCYGIQILERTCEVHACPIGQWSWNDWGQCSNSCGGGIRIKTADKCLPKGAFCEEAPVIEESCNQESCPGPSTFLPPGTIVSWVPKPNQSSPSNGYSFNDDTWIICDGVTTCKKGLFRGEACSDLSDRALIGAGRTGVLLDLKDASMPDHEHKHKHTGSKRYSISYLTGGAVIGTKKNPNGDKGSVAKSHNHDIVKETSANVNFADMSEESAPITRILASKVTKTTNENELYSPHMRVRFMFKCY